ncbi:hypothetical protein JCM10213_001963 [Rhodosporidiobolus nylandii]
MAEVAGAVLNTIAGVTARLPQPFSSIDQLMEAEEEDAKRIRPSNIGWWRDVSRVRGSTLWRVWKAVVLFTVWGTVVAVMDLVYGRDLGLTNNVTPMLSVVVGLLLVFRNSSAYARWEDGRKTFGKMMSTVRNLTRSIWVIVGAPIAAKSPAEALASIERLSEKDHEEKIKAVRLLVAFVIATKHHVRREYGVDWPDLASILPPKFQALARTTGFGWDPAETDYDTPSAAPSTAAPSPGAPSPGAPSPGQAASPTKKQRPAPQPLHASYLSAPNAENGTAGPRLDPPLASPVSFRSIPEVPEGERRPLLGKYRAGQGLNTETMVVMADYMRKPSLPLPLVIAHQLGLYLASCKRRGLIESIGPAGYNALVMQLNGLVDCFTACERLASTGIPTVYTVHLKQCTSLFLLTLPLVLVELMGFSMIPFVTVVAFTLVGIEAIANEIEMPFGIDDSDLPLDLFCAELRNEVEHMVSRLSMLDEEFSL